MSILNNQIYKNDIELTKSQVLDFKKLRESRILVTGASGLICSAVIDVLIDANLDITVYAAGRNKTRIDNRFCGLVSYVPYDATKSIDFDIDFDIDYIIHGASNASPELYVNQPVETMLVNFYGTYNLLEYAKKKKCKRVVYISSSEVYGKKENLEPYKENQYGYVDLLSERSSYSTAKRAAETLCESYKKEYGVDYCIVRPGHIYGPSALKSDRRVSSEFAYKAADACDLIMKSEGTQKRSYCYSLDCASAILSVLTTGESGQAYNISNKYSVISIREMAQCLAKAGGVELLFDIPTSVEKKRFNPMDNSSLDSTKIEDMGWTGVFAPEIGLAHTVKILSQVSKGGTAETATVDFSYGCDS